MPGPGMVPASDWSDLASPASDWLTGAQGGRVCELPSSERVISEAGVRPGGAST